MRLIVIAHMYGTPGKIIDEIIAIADRQGALIVEDAAESLGATYKRIQTGMFGTESVILFNGINVLETELGREVCNKQPNIAA